MKSGEVRRIGIVTDQKPIYRASKIWQNLFGNETAFNIGGSVMACMTNYPCYYLKIDRLKRGYYELELIKIGEGPNEKGDKSMLINFVREVEKQIENTPENWLWSHDRWKYNRRKGEELHQEPS